MAFHGIHINPKNKGKFARAVGKKPGTPITSKDISKGLNSSNPKEREEANFARNARKWKHGKRRKSKAESLYGKKEQK